MSRSYLPLVWEGNLDPGTDLAGIRRNDNRENRFFVVSGICCVAQHPFLKFELDTRESRKQPDLDRGRFASIQVPWLRQQKTSAHLPHCGSATSCSWRSSNSSSTPRKLIFQPVLGFHPFAWRVRDSPFRKCCAQVLWSRLVGVGNLTVQLHQNLWVCRVVLGIPFFHVRGRSPTRRHIDHTKSRLTCHQVSHRESSRIGSYSGGRSCGKGSGRHPCRRKSQSIPHLVHSLQFRSPSCPRQWRTPSRCRRRRHLVPIAPQGVDGQW